MRGLCALSYLYLSFVLCMQYHYCDYLSCATLRCYMSVFICCFFSVFTCIYSQILAWLPSHEQFDFFCPRFGSFWLPSALLALLATTRRETHEFRFYLSAYIRDYSIPCIRRSDLDSLTWRQRSLAVYTRCVTVYVPPVNCLVKVQPVLDMSGQ